MRTRALLASACQSPSGVLAPSFAACFEVVTDGAAMAAACAAATGLSAGGLSTGNFSTFEDLISAIAGLNGSVAGDGGTALAVVSTACLFIDVAAVTSGAVT